MIDDTAKLVSTYEACQKFSHRSKSPTPSWPLQRWGIDIVGNLTPAQGNYTFAVVAVEYFTKWIEVKHVTSVTSANHTTKFLAKHHLPLQSSTANHSRQRQVFR
jgi:hypothetical protein